MLNRIIFFALFLANVGITAHAQKQQVYTGIIVDSATFSPLPFVTVRIKNSMRGTSTDVQGNFSISATERDTLVFSLVGYQAIEQPLWNYESSIIRMTEKGIMLESVTIESKAIGYEGMFDDENAKLARRKLPFYLSKSKKQKRKLTWLREDNIRAKTYVDVVINNPETKSGLMKKYSLTEDQYYKLLGDFNAQNYTIMYYLTAGELMTLINNFYEKNAGKK
ncbi:carboxypeptidase-like regulatory domain-containing protein [Ohtaekwangia kribbensis]|uniref:Carboxypeptidase-like regulatory domain-containing protein n=1 Tax=Ohtaekwangia kribbensis TaxID=688913 RepID=A0ABW3K6E5_9BACT